MDINIKGWITEHQKSIFYKYIYAIVLYSILLVNNLVNRQDGIWNGPTYCAGNWELSIGRWALRYVDVARFAISVNPWTSLITLILFVIGTEFVIDVFRIKTDSKWNYLGSFMFLSNIIVCDVLSYTYTSNAYGLAFLLSVLSVKLINIGYEGWTNNRRSAVLALIAGMIVLGGMMGVYQNYLGCTCVFILACIIGLLTSHTKLADVIRYTITSLVTGIGGFIAYEIVLKIELIHWGVTLSDYNGANSISVGKILSSLNETLPKAYGQSFYYMITGEKFKWNLFQGKAMLLIIGVALILFITTVINKLWSGNKPYILLVLVILGLIPMAANISVILAPECMYWEQQTAPIAVIIPCLIWIFANLQVDVGNAIINALAMLITIVLLWGSMYQVIIDQEAMREGVNSAVTIATEAVGCMLTDESYDSSKPVAVFGTPYGNVLFNDTGISEKASLYARIGGYSWFGGYTDLYNWKGILEHRMGIRLNYCSDNDYVDLRNSETVINMPSYPERGCVQTVNGINVIKISDF